MTVNVAWRKGQRNEIKFILTDANGNEVTGLGENFDLNISAPGDNAFVPGAGDKSELGSGFYRYLATVNEASAQGSVAITASGLGAVQQNLEYIVEHRNALGVEFTYTLTDGVTAAPIEGAFVEFSTESDMSNIVWAGVTDANGVAKDSYARLPYLDPGTYTIRLRKAGYSFDLDTEVVD